MNQRHLQNVFYVSVDVNLMVGNVNRDKNETMINVNVSVKNQKHIARVKRIMSGILLHGLASVIKIMKLVNT